MTGSWHIGKQMKICAQDLVSVCYRTSATHNLEVGIEITQYWSNNLELVIIEVWSYSFIVKYNFCQLYKQTCMESMINNSIENGALINFTIETVYKSWTQSNINNTLVCDLVVRWIYLSCVKQTQRSNIYYFENELRIKKIYQK